ncbi:hypothetical protein CPB86DRAFT_329350 [Serendipita vermifera]|nr:hypothetical protein CPB86DRAFT_329350 [Serendipita vermifera]
MLAYKSIYHGIASAFSLSRFNYLLVRRHMSIDAFRSRSRSLSTLISLSVYSAVTLDTIGTLVCFGNRLHGFLSCECRPIFSITLSNSPHSHLLWSSVDQFVQGHGDPHVLVRHLTRVYEKWNGALQHSHESLQDLQVLHCRARPLRAHP